VHENGDFYEGTFFHGMKNGHGSLLFANTGASYDGEWVDDKMSIGMAKSFAILSGGQIRAGVMSPAVSPGRIRPKPTQLNQTGGPSGSRIGNNNNEDPTTSTSMDTDDQSSNHNHSSYHLSGGGQTSSWDVVEDETVMNSGIYDGQIVDGVPSGPNGVCLYSDGSKYQGVWRNGRRNGPGSLVTAGGNEYVGKWVGDQRSGKGVWRTLRGELYEVRRREKKNSSD
jgi:hypothetical protein